MLTSKNFSIILVLTLSCITITCAFAVRDKFGDYNSEGSFAKMNGKERYNNTVGKDAHHKKSGFSISAVGLIVLILTVILSGIFIYYFFLFYPILCRKERNYDVVEHSRDTTPTPNTDNPL